MSPGVREETTARELLRLRTRRLNQRPVAAKADGGRYVLCWLRQALRAEENPALDAAILLANDLGLPVVVLHALENRYPHASVRLHRFILEASRELGDGVEARGIRFVRWVRRTGESGVDLHGTLSRRAAAVVLDDVPVFTPRRWAESVAARIDRAVLAVDACRLVPMAALTGKLGTTKAFRAAHTKLRPLHLEADLRQEPDAERYGGELEMRSEPVTDLAGDRLDAVIREAGVDDSVPPVEDFPGGRSAALERLAFAVPEVVPRYKWTRNNPALADGSTRISPWMHFGVLSPREVAKAVLDAEAEGLVHPAARYKFLDEMLTWREYYHHRAVTHPGWTCWSGLPTWARETLLAHASDPRPKPLPLDALIHGETDDETWNAAQKSFLLDGFMNNNLRMYWVKQILRWREDPRDAWAVACYLNDRFSLDGRDANTYGGIRWAFGDGRAGYREVPIYGKTSPKSDAPLRKRSGMPGWIERQAAREPFRASVPEEEGEVLALYLC